MNYNLSKNSGVLITFEGGEGAGKTTLINHLYGSLSSETRSVMKTRQPGGTPLGAKIRELLLTPAEKPVAPLAELFLFLADRAQHVEESIRPALDKGTIVLCDRFCDSTIAYQGAARGLDLDLIEELCLFSTSDLIPDLTFYLDIDPKIGFERVRKERGKGDRIEQETLEFHTRIRDCYLALAEKEPHRIFVLDATDSIEEIHQTALEIVHGLLAP